MNLNGLMDVAERNKKIHIEKRFSLEVGPAKKLPKRQVDPKAIKALLERKEKERETEKDRLISKAVDLGKRDETNYKDRKGLLRADAERSDKCKKQWLKNQKERRDFFAHMNKSADERDKNKKVLDKDTVMSSVKQKEAADSEKKRKRKVEPYLGSTESMKKPKLKHTPSKAPKVTDINELMRIARKNAQKKAFASTCDTLPDIKKPAETERLMTKAERRRLEEEAAIQKKRETCGLPRIPKVGQAAPSSNGKIPKKSSDKDSKKDEKRPDKPKSSSSSSKPSSNGSHKVRESSHSEKPRKQEPERPKVSQNGKHSNGTSKSSSSSQSQPQSIPKSSSTTQSRQPDSKPAKMPKRSEPQVPSRPSNGQTMPSSEREKIARQLAQLQRERQLQEEAERRQRALAKKQKVQVQERKKPTRPDYLKQRQQRVSEDEYEEDDEDLDEYEDDFIDDGPTNDPYAKVYSKTIAKIFNYDKRKYIDMDDDDIEESNFSRCMAEEARSARLGRQEDLEDMRQEAEDLKRKNSKVKMLEELSRKRNQKKKLTLCPV